MHAVSFCLFFAFVYLGHAVADQSRTFSVKKEQINRGYACESNPLELHCSTGYEIHLRSAFFGADRVAACGPNRDSMWIPPCGDYMNTIKTLKDSCEGNETCKIQEQLRNIILDCEEGPKYLEVYYQCRLKAGFCRNGMKELSGCESICDNITCADMPNSYCLPDKCNPNRGCYAAFRDQKSGRFVPCKKAMDASFDPPRLLNLVNGVYIPGRPNIAVKGEMLEAKGWYNHSGKPRNVSDGAGQYKNKTIGDSPDLIEASVRIANELVNNSMEMKATHEYINNMTINGIRDFNNGKGDAKPEYAEPNPTKHENATKNTGNSLNGNKNQTQSTIYSKNDAQTSEVNTGHRGNVNGNEGTLHNLEHEPLQQNSLNTPDEPEKYCKDGSAFDGFGNGEFELMEQSAFTLDECVGIVNPNVSGRKTGANAAAIRKPNWDLDKGPFDCFMKINQSKASDSMHFANCYFA